MKLSNVLIVKPGSYDVIFYLLLVILIFFANFSNYVITQLYLDYQGSVTTKKLFSCWWTGVEFLRSITLCNYEHSAGQHNSQLDMALPLLFSPLSQKYYFPLTIVFSLQLAVSGSGSERGSASEAAG